MACQNSKCTQTHVQECPQNDNNYGNSLNFVIILVLYILLAIILGSWIWY